MSMAKELKKLGAKGRQTGKGSVWEGPNGTGPQGGVTFSLLSRFLVCRERFRLHVIEGLRPRDHFNSRLEFGNMWHVCEEAFIKVSGSDNSEARTNLLVNEHGVLLKYAQSLCRQYPTQRSQIDHWYNVCRAQFPLYVEWWKYHPDMQNRRPLLQEQPFDVPYALPSGRTVRLRGKWDSVDLVGEGKDAAVWLQENKTKSAIDAAKVERQLRFDLQTMMYLVALQEFRNDPEQTQQSAWKSQGYDAQVLGVRYNVVRRSAHKSVESMLKKVEDDRAHGRMGEWFARWNVRVGPDDVTRFRRECLDPILENLCDDYEWWVWCNDPYKFHHPRVLTSYIKEAVKSADVFNGEQRRKLFPDHCQRHYRHPFGVYNVLDEGGSSDLDAYLAGEGEVGLQRTNNLFPELS